MNVIINILQIRTNRNKINKKMEKIKKEKVKGGINPEGINNWF